MGLTYKNAGVDLNTADMFEEMIKERVEGAWPGTGGEIGKFAGGGPIPYGAQSIMAGTDGPGTKILVAAMIGEIGDIGQDVAAMSAVDVYVAGGEPKYLIDTLKVNRLNPKLHIRVIEGLIRGCILAGCQLIGGETAELPGMFRHPWMIDLDATVIGFPAPERAYDPVCAGQKVYGWPSYGVCSNGFSLIRRVFGLQRQKTARPKLYHHYQSLGASLAKALLRPTPIWIQQAEAQRRRGVRFAGHAHITGGGMAANIQRILPCDCKVVIHRGAWKRPPIFPLIQMTGRVSGEEMDAVFNNGIIMVSLISEAGEEVNDENAILIGEVAERKEGEYAVELVGEYCDK